MTLNKGIFINQIKEGDAVEGVFLVKELSHGETKTKKLFLRLTVLDKSGEIGGPVWDNAETLAPYCQPGCFIQISGQGERYRDTPQLRINRVTAVNANEVDLADFMPSGEVNHQELKRELHALIAGIKNHHLRRLLSSIFQDSSGILAQFTTAPAAKTMHHAYLGGLLEHTVAVARLAAVISTLYPAIDRDLLLAGALLHDLGKIEELTYESYPFGYSSRGRLVGHLVIGAEAIREKATVIPEFPPELLERLQHLILSHHGRHEFGSPTLPMIQEAFILHLLDDLDAKVNYFAKLSRQTEQPGYQWSEYQRHLERFLYFRGHNSAEAQPVVPLAAPLAAQPKPLVTAPAPIRTIQAPAETTQTSAKATQAQESSLSLPINQKNSDSVAANQVSQEKSDAIATKSVSQKKRDAIATSEEDLTPRQKGLWG